MAIGYVLPAFFVSEADTLPENLEQARTDVFNSLVLQTIIGTAVLVLILFFFREQPPTPPSSTHAIVTGSLKEEIRVCLREPALVRLVVVFGLILGLMNTYGTIMGIVAT